ncbi:MAG: hypothetical protein GXY44_01895 [Phycisphaerales bacterium]|nr:hypothetical protein [Phycisphaerales bacterium]
MRIYLLAAMVWLAGGVFPNTTAAKTLRIGWAQADITPSEPVCIAGQFHVRVSEGVLDPITATALALESVGDQTPAAMVLVSCDLIAIHDSLRDALRDHLRRDLPELDPMAVLIAATHTHSAPLTSTHERYDPLQTPVANIYGDNFGAMAPADYVTYAAERIARAVIEAWRRRAPGGIAYGLGHAVVGRNRLTTYLDGRSRMYGPVNDPEFSHMEGYENPALHVLATYSADRRMTGLILNLACPAQVSESSMKLSSDFWHETREELRSRFGESLFVLAQNAPSGDQSPHLPGNECSRPSSETRGENPEVRMWRLAGRSQQEEIGVRIADAVGSILPLIEKEIVWAPILAHRVETIELPRRLIPAGDVEQARSEAAKQRAAYEALMSDRQVNPELLRDRQWAHNVSRAFRLMRRNERVMERFEFQQTHPTVAIELHAARLGDIAFASNPFELYLDYGLRIQARTRAVQTFLVQLAGPGSYVPTARSVAGGAYGAVPASTEVGPDGGQVLVERTIAAVNAFWEE